MKASLLISLLVLVALSTLVLAAPRKPVWPTQFSSPFGFNMFLPPTRNASATLFYNWDIKSQVVEYKQHCVPFVGPSAWFYPCKLYFNPSGIYVSQPKAGIDCCSFVPGVGSIPADFLAPFNFSNVEPAADMWGKMRSCNHWVGIDGFAYWTDVDTEEDVQFKDGDTGVFWNFGEFDVVRQDPAIFKLPPGNCNKPCFGASKIGHYTMAKMYGLFQSRGPQ